MKIATWNVNGIRARGAQLCDWIERDKPDVVCLQELKARPDQVPEACKALEYHVFWHGERAYSGVSLHIRKGLFEGEPVFSHPAFDMETRIVTAQFDKLVLASVYVPNGGKDYAAKIDFLTKLAAWANDVHAQGNQLILCGDINIAHSDMDLHPKERKPGVIGQRPEERALLDQIMGNDMVDVLRKMHPENDRIFSWWAPWRDMRKKNIGWRIDYILASRSLAERASECNVLADIGTSDHAPVAMTVAT
jgi:exodeoxyribonuclease III